MDGGDEIKIEVPFLETRKQSVQRSDGFDRETWSFDSQMVHFSGVLLLPEYTVQ